MKDLTERRAVYLDDAIEAIVGCTNCGTEDELRAYAARHSLENLWTGGIVDAIDAIKRLPSAQPEIIRCKDCKHWKDSDGVYRRGHGSESKCRINHVKVQEGTFYCGMAERRTDEQV